MVSDLECVQTVLTHGTSSTIASSPSQFISLYIIDAKHHVENCKMSTLWCTKCLKKLEIWFVWNDWKELT